MPTRASTAIHRHVDAARAGELDRVIARMPAGWAVMGEHQRLPGYALLLPDPVVPTLNDLHGDARATFLRDMAALGDAVLRVTGALRINYAMLGNLEPALHAHVVPRYADEPEHYRTLPHFAYPPEQLAEHPFDARKHAALRDQLAAALAT